MSFDYFIEMFLFKCGNSIIKNIYFFYDFFGVIDITALIGKFMLM